MILDPLQHIADLSEICHRFGVAWIVISPGSRNATLIDAFTCRFGDRCFSIVDERSAGYFALGLAKESRKPVALICTSGTATLNYGPSLAEAYYQGVPLLAITADRPEAWIDQQDNQTIRQPGIYRNYIKHSINLPENLQNNEDLQKLHQQVKTALQTAISGAWGPIHINVPLREPLYGDIPPASGEATSLAFEDVSSGSSLPEKFLTDWKAAERIMIIQGQDPPSAELQAALSKLATDPRIVLIAENISNIRNEETISCPELLLSHSDSTRLPKPDLLIYSGGQVVSRKLKAWLRSFSIPSAWRLGQDLFEMDTFSQKNTFLRLPQKEAYKKLAGYTQEGPDEEYKATWLKNADAVRQVRDKLLDSLPFSDLKVVDQLMESLPEGSIVELGNSSPVRLSQLSKDQRGHVYYSNRGVSGIDGCLSTAVGTALSSGALTFVLLGDLGFVYDSNALWNRELPSNLRIVVLNNQGRS